MFISIKYRGIEHSRYPLTDKPYQVSSVSVTPAVIRASKELLKMKFPGMEIDEQEIKVEPCSEFIWTGKVKPWTVKNANILRKLLKTLKPDAVSMGFYFFISKL